MSIINQVAVNSAASVNFLDQLKAWWQELHNRMILWLASLDLNSMKVVEILACGGAGFVVGLLLKKHLRTLVLFLVLFGGVVWALQELKLIVINWDYVHQITNLGAGTTLQTLATKGAEWLKFQLLQVVGFAIGFLIGYKV